MHDESKWDGKDIERQSVIKCFITENMIDNLGQNDRAGASVFRVFNARLASLGV
jgi:hypothetical protein